MPFTMRGGGVALLAIVAGASYAQPADKQATPPAASVRPAPAISDPGDGGLTAELFYRILLGDVALQRGEPALAARAYLDVARETRDVRLTRRAAEIAYQTRQRTLAEQAARLWLELEPDAQRPRQMLTVIASGNMPRDAGEGAEADLRARLEKLFADAAASGDGVAEPFLQINRLFAQQPDKVAVFRLIQDLAKPYPASPEAQFAVGLAGYNTGLTDPAIGKATIDAADRALALRPGWDRAALLKAEILAKGSRTSAIDFLRAFQKQAPDSKLLRTGLAQLLVEDRRYDEARAIYQKLLAENPTQLEYQFALAALAMQAKDWTAAEEQLTALKRAGYGEDGLVEIYLAQVAEEQQRYDEAIRRYAAVPDGERGWLAKLRIAGLMGKTGKVAEARRYLADLPAVTIEQRVQVRQAEAQLLREAGDVAGAYEVLGKGLVEHPDSPELIYDRAMVAEKLDKIAEAEAGLRRLMAMRPEDPHTLNALGYTLVDRTSRVDEGFVLIQKANALSPNDPFILDSMGWALYRLGRMDEAVVFLKRAFAERPDPEIAAHLGEVLWAKGEPDRAREVWQSQLGLTPDNPMLLETVRRHVK
jgi:tetratricopeptide (TPR) repeat protein